MIVSWWAGFRVRLPQPKSFSLTKQARFELLESAKPCRLAGCELSLRPALQGRSPPNRASLPNLQARAARWWLRRSVC